ncbi:expressed unknown protein [Seminavis robusta]|uniref:Uncharacterized protein n=1 Tax=Seminavis robusta TaxID=568900 RepID=A0A9N8EW67_9STRA|nr:expressed unknown protein [Seminavis robusta]|eukprot:Sro1868_g302620.1 n/a (789) ;mRNA; f:14079-16539
MDEGNDEDTKSSICREAVALCKIEWTNQDISATLERSSEAKESTREIEDHVAYLEGLLAEANAQKEVCTSREKGLKRKLEGLKQKKTAQENHVQDIVERGNLESPRELNILGLGEKESELSEEETQVLQAIQDIRNFMEAGKLEEARTAEAALAAWVNSDDDLVFPDPTRILGAHHAKRAQFVRPYSICSSEDVEATLEYASERPEEVIPPLAGDAIMEFMMGMMGNPQKCPKPPHIKLQVLNEIRCFAMVLDKARKAARKQVAEDSDDDDEEEEDSDSEDEEDRRQRKLVGKRAISWNSIEVSIRKHQELKLKHNTMQLELPSDKSAPIARFNTEAHFRFASPTSLESTPDLTRAMVRCELRELSDDPTLSSSKEGTSSLTIPRPAVYEAWPEEFDRGRFHMDLDGDWIGRCGGKEVDCFPVPSPESDHGPDIPELRELREGPAGKDWYTGCIADSKRKLVWATNGTGDLHGFSCESTEKVASLSFGKQEKMKNRRFFGDGFFNICRVGNHIVGSGVTSNLSVWCIDQALENFASNGDKPMAPSRVRVEDASSKFECGEISWLGGSNILVGAAQIEEDGRYNPSLRQFDLEREAVVGLYCGLKGGMSIEKQHCFERFNSILLADSHFSYVFDVRTFKPSITLDTGHIEGQILGIPGPAAMTAFAFSQRNAENIQCWDLRMPASHAYSMWTGNNSVNGLFWHERTASLIASTSNLHHLHLRNIRSGERAARGEWYPESDADDDSDWPEEAVHDPGYFGNSKWCRDIGFSALIQYSFNSGKPVSSPSKE